MSLFIMINFIALYWKVAYNLISYIILDKSELWSIKDNKQKIIECSKVDILNAKEKHKAALLILKGNYEKSYIFEEKNSQKKQQLVFKN